MRFALMLALFLVQALARAAVPQATEHDFLIADFPFRSGETLSELRIHYRTLGVPRRNAAGEIDNAVLILHGTGGSGAQFLGANFAGELFGPGQPLDAERYYLILPDDIGHGGSSKPSEGLRARFPAYGYTDMVDTEHRLVTEGLGIKRLRLVMGTSMGGMHTWMWGTRYPDAMAALMPLASLPVAIAGRNRAWRRVVIDAIRNDPGWAGGEYITQPPSLRIASQMLWLMSSNPVQRQQQAPTLAAADQALEEHVTRLATSLDVNDFLYALESSRDYDPAPDLGNIRVPLLAVNSADDLINPPELGILERETARIPGARAVVLPLSEATRGHSTHTEASVWKPLLEELLRDSEPR